MSSFLNYFSLWDSKHDTTKSNDYFIEVMQKYKDIWEFAQQRCDRVICCPRTSTLTDAIRRDDLERHVLIPTGGAGEFVSLKGDKVIFSG